MGRAGDLDAVRSVLAAAGPDGAPTLLSATQVRAGTRTIMNNICCSAVMATSSVVCLEQNGGETALLGACAGGHVSVVEVLLDAGANPGKHKVRVHLCSLYRLCLKKLVFL